MYKTVRTTRDWHCGEKHGGNDGATVDVQREATRRRSKDSDKAATEKEDKTPEEQRSGNHGVSSA